MPEEYSLVLLDLNYPMPEPEAVLSSAPGLPAWMAAGSGTGLGSLLQFMGSLTYDFSSFMYRDSALLAGARMKAPAWGDFLDQAGLRDLGHKLQKNLDRLDSSKGERELAIDDYVRLFETPDPPIPIRESVWFSKKELPWEDKDVGSQCRLFGYTQSPLISHDDHIGAETQVCGWLYDNAADRNGAFSAEYFSSLASSDARRPTLNDLRAFVQQHFGRWAPECYTLLSAYATSVFWKETCQLGNLLAQQLVIESGGCD